MGSLRSTVEELQPQFLGTTNPGGAGHEWVKKYWHITDIEFENGKKFEEEGISKLFVPANIEENRHLADKDPKYVQFLKNLPPELRAKWYEGSWEDVDTPNQYYANLLTKAKQNNRITSVPIEGSLRTFAAIDLGVNDNMALWIWQIHGKEVRFIDFYVNRNQPLKHYSDYMYALKDEFSINIEKLYVPHDANVRSMTSDTLMTRKEKLEELGFNVEFAPNVGREDGIEACRELLTHCYFDDKRTHEGVRGLKAYQKEFDEKMNRYKDTPLHDWSSDYADGFRYAALSVPKEMGTTSQDMVSLQKNLIRRRHGRQNNWNS